MLPLEFYFHIVANKIDHKPVGLLSYYYWSVI